MNNYFDKTRQAALRKEIARLTTECSLPFYNEDGTNSGLNDNEGMRERLWNAAAFLENGSDESVRLANNIIRRGMPGYRHCHFLPFVSMQVLKRYEPLLDADCVKLLEEYVLKFADSFTGAGMDFIGCNDNFPAMGAALLLMAGQRFGKPEYIGIVRRRLRELSRIFARSGFLGEYNSPTYSPISAAAMAEIAEVAEDDEIRKLALGAEVRVWTDMLAHFHPKTCQMAPPYSRAYAIDIFGCSHQARMMYHMLYGDKCAVMPFTSFMREHSPETVPHHNENFLRISYMWLLLPDYHCPAELARHALEKSFPYVVSGTSEGINCRESARLSGMPSEVDALFPDWYENPFRKNHLYTYMTEDFALGSSSASFHDGAQSYSQHLIYSRGINDLSLPPDADTGTVFVRYSVNDSMPDAYDGTGSAMDNGQKSVVQHLGASMSLYNPRPFAVKDVRSLSLEVCVQTLYGVLPDEMRVGGKRLTLSLGKRSEPALLHEGAPEAVYFRSGNVFVKILPLLPNDGLEGRKLRVRAFERFISISLMNYEGEARGFTPSELFAMRNGVVIEAAQAAEYGSFDDFVRKTEAVVTDTIFAKTRKVRYEREGLSLETQYAPMSQSRRFFMANDLPVDEPVLSMSGFDAKTLPFMK